MSKVYDYAMILLEDNPNDEQVQDLLSELDPNEIVSDVLDAMIDSGEYNLALAQIIIRADQFPIDKKLLEYVINYCNRYGWDKIPELRELLYEADLPIQLALYFATDNSDEREMLRHRFEQLSALDLIQYGDMDSRYLNKFTIEIR